MANEPRIRIMERDKKEYARLIKNAKAKIRRVKKKYGLDLSDKINIPSLKDFETRSQFNEFKQNQSMFTNRANQNYQFQKNKHNVVASKKEINELKRLTEQAQKNANELIDKYSKLPFYQKGKQVSTVGQRAQMMKRPAPGGIYPVKDFNFDKYWTRGDFEGAFDKIGKKANPGYYDERTEIMKENYLQLIREAFHSDGDDLYKSIDMMDALDFYDMYLSNDEFDFEEFYNENGEVEGKPQLVNGMEATFQRYINGNNEYKDLKEF